MNFKEKNDSFSTFATSNRDSNTRWMISTCTADWNRYRDGDSNSLQTYYKAQ